jgi:hypothetical protein
MDSTMCFNYWHIGGFIIGWMVYSFVFGFIKGMIKTRKQELALKGLYKMPKHPPMPSKKTRFIGYDFGPANRPAKKFICDSCKTKTFSEFCISCVEKP